MSDEFMGYYSHRVKKPQASEGKRRRRREHHSSEHGGERRKRSRMRLDLDGRKEKDFFSRGINVLWVGIAALVFVLGVTLMGYDAYQEYLKNNLSELAPREDVDGPSSTPSPQGGNPVVDSAMPTPMEALPGAEVGVPPPVAVDPFEKGLTLAAPPEGAPAAGGLFPESTPAAKPPENTALPEPVQPAVPASAAPPGAAGPETSSVRRAASLPEIVKLEGKREAVEALTLALQALQSGLTDQARGLFTEARTLDPSVKNGDIVEAWLLFREEKIAPARDLAGKIVAARPGELAARRILCDCLWLLGGGVEWERQVDAALAAHPGDPFLLAHRAQILRGSGRVMEGLYWVDQLPYKKNALWEAHRRLALIQSGVGGEDVEGWKWRYSDEYLDMYWAVTAAAEAWMRKDEAGCLDYLRKGMKLSKNRLDLGFLLQDAVFAPLRERPETKVLFNFTSLPAAPESTPSTSPPL